LDGCTEIAEKPDAFIEYDVSLSVINLRLSDNAAVFGASAALNAGTWGKLELISAQPNRVVTAHPTTESFENRNMFMNHLFCLSHTPKAISVPKFSIYKHINCEALPKGEQIKNGTICAYLT